MALNGSKSTTFTNNSQFTLISEWSAKQNVGGNNSTITVTLKLKSGPYGQTYGWSNKTAYISIDGQSQTFSVNPNMGPNQTKTLATLTKTVSHGADGKKNVAINSNVNFSGIQWNGGWLGTVYANGNYTLNPIARASTMTVSHKSIDFGGKPSFNISTASAGFTHTLQYSYAGKTVNIATGLKGGTYNSWVVPTSLMKEIPSSLNLTLSINLVTYSGSTRLGTQSHSLKCDVPSNVVPSIGTPTVTEGDSVVSRIIGNTGVTTQFLQAKSELLIKADTSGSNGSRINKTTASLGGTISTFSGNTGVIKLGNASVSPGSNNIVIETTDSRGRKATKNLTVNIIAYLPPTVTKFTATRNPSDPTLLTFVKAGSVTPIVMGSTQKNPYTVVITQTLGTTTTTVESLSNSFGTNKTTRVDSTKAYEYLLTVKDQFTSVSKKVSTPTAKALLHLHKDEGIGIGKMHERGVLDINGDVFLGGDGVIKASQNKYYETGGAFNMNNSDIVSANGIYFGIEGTSDVADNLGEGLVFGRSDTGDWKVPENWAMTTAERNRYFDTFYMRDEKLFINSTKIVADPEVLQFIEGGMVFQGQDGTDGVVLNRWGNVRFTDKNINTNNWKISTGAGNEVIRVFNNAKKSEPLTFNSDSTSDFIMANKIYNRTYSSAPNLHITQNGVLGRSTSASKYKIEIEDVEDYDYKSLLKLKHKAWFDKANHERFYSFKKEVDKLEKEDLRPIERKLKVAELKEEFGDIQALEKVHGLIAEDLVDAGLKEFVFFDDTTGEVEGIQYDRLVVPLIELVKSQQADIDALKKHVGLLV